uniref:RNA ligase domain-containing protein n=1 Tax=Chromera velia CCMP2878 TaxID=1169474 RepID=A0A0G4IE40_9ALVE|eukprot:Cvel_13473.t1-p1 / transcript=Cvel_13473.t1 / gene=Cvel_13473 / organism=Chromera_velia_CCMP2878 / gene_product=RNA-editing ligase 2, mitochondrial, putative / transcript_product=RNA-editing ligase 2, mitochondrial, putative / location=Cvel_scaffold921:59262-61259(+) / protein_length=666 / sequence_SO=supercontig / SO=protein_coding / is_pseudo=false
MTETDHAATKPAASGNRPEKRGSGGGGKGGGKRGPKGGVGGGAASSEKKPTKIKEEVFLVMCMATSGRTPQTGSLLSLAACGITADRKIVGIFHRNLQPRLEAVAAADSLGFWHARPRELAEVTRDPVPARDAFRDLLSFCASFSKCTLVGTPILSIYPFLQHHLELYCPDTTSPPWGFSGCCARSFASGVLGVSMKDLAAHAGFKAACEDMMTIGVPRDECIPTGVPINDCIHGAIYYTALLRLSLGLEAKPLEWACDKPTRGLGKLKTPVSERVRAEKPLPFIEYPSITDPDFDPNRFFMSVAEKAAEGYDGEWVATEKVHGANLSFITDGELIRAAKRTGLLSVEDARLFFQFDYLLAECEEQLLKLHAAIAASKPEEQRAGMVVTVFGELAGGEYRHPAVVPNLNGRRVQSGVQYAPHNFFYPFDIAVGTPTPLTTEPNEPSDSASPPLTWTFLPFDHAQGLLAETGFPTARVLGRFPSLTEALRTPCEFTSTLPEQFGLPPLGVANFAEGLVVRPAGAELAVTTNTQNPPKEANGSAASEKADPSRESQCSQGGDQSRVMIKIKHPLFREFTSVKAPKDAPLLDVARQMVTQARIDAVLSKYDSRERTNTDRMVRLVAEDALKDAHALRGENSTDLDSELREKLLTGLQQLAFPLVQTKSH